MKSFKILIPAIISMILISSCKGVGDMPGSNVLKVEPTSISLIPQPKEMHTGTQFFTLPAVNVICHNPEATKSAEWLRVMLEKAKLGTQTKQGNSCGTWNLIVDASLEGELGEEGYTLEINSRGVFMQAAS